MFPLGKELDPFRKFIGVDPSQKMRESARADINPKIRNRNGTKESNSSLSSRQTFLKDGSFVINIVVAGEYLTP